MRILISPAKKMNIDTDSLPYETLPQFLPQTQTLLHTLQHMDDHALQALWGCNDALAALNISRLRQMDLRKNLTPALLAYEGLQYRAMAPGVFESTHFDYIRQHLRILSGFYGLLRPFDGVTPYRLELQARLQVGAYANLYAFWGEKPAQQLCTETDFILNLASREYSKLVAAHLPKGIRFLTCTFGELQGTGRVVENGTLCKIARGEMVRYLAETNATTAQDIQAFHRLGYAYCKVRSQDDQFVFLKSPPADAATW